MSAPTENWIDTPEGKWTIMSVIAAVMSVVLPVLFIVVFASLSPNSQLYPSLPIRLFFYLYFPAVLTFSLYKLHRAKQDQ